MYAKRTFRVVAPQVIVAIAGIAAYWAIGCTSQEPTTGRNLCETASHNERVIATDSQQCGEWHGEWIGAGDASGNCICIK